MAWVCYRLGEPKGRSWRLKAHPDRRTTRSFPSIVLKNSIFRVDHNLEDCWQPRWNFLWGFGGPPGFAACDLPIRPAVRPIGRNDPTGAKTRFSRSLNFRVFQHRVMGGALPYRLLRSARMWKRR